MFRTHSILMGIFIFGCSYCKSDNSKDFWLWDDRACLIDETDYLDGGAVARQRISASHNSSQVLIQAPIDPWTNEPSCSRTYGNQYCTFTHSKFSNGRGITIITTPDIAAELSTLAALVESSSLQSTASQPYVAQNIPGKGVGLVATRTLFTGEMIFAHPPASLHHNGIFESMPWREKEFVIRESINSLPFETRKMWWDLDWQGSREDLVEDIINTNSFKAFLGSNKTLHSMMSLEMSRMNHDCRPNVRHSFSNSTFSHAAYASRTIYAGEELTISYINSLMRSSTRRQALKRGWGFDCACSFCRQERLEEAPSA